MKQNAPQAAKQETNGDRRLAAEKLGEAVAVRLGRLDPRSPGRASAPGFLPPDATSRAFEHPMAF